MAGQFRFAKLSLERGDVWLYCAVQHHVCRKPKHSVSELISHTNCLAKGGGVLIWDCFAATGPGHLGVIESAMNSSAQWCGG